MPELHVVCHSCAAPARFEDTVPRSAHCERCGMDLRCCRCCKFYDPSCYNECAEPSAERVVEKDRANFCDYFTPRPQGSGAAVPGSASGGSTADALEDLFRKR